VKDILPGPDHSYIDQLTNVNGTLFFTAYETTTGRELWKSDGTEPGTSMVADICPGPCSSAPSDLTNANGMLVFSACTEGGECEVWRSDGTVQGTQQLADINQGEPSSNPTGFTVSGGLLYCAADDEWAGRELWTLASWGEPDIEVSPLAYSFGDVEVGSSSTLVITISNVGTVNLTVNYFSPQSGWDYAFSIASAPEVPFILAPLSTVDLAVTYTPSATGSISSVLEISSNDPDEPLVQVDLSGTGIEEEIPPLEQISDILDFIDDSVASDTLAGDGPGNSAEHRLNALINMIEAAGDLIQQGDIEAACQQLLDAYRKTDGQPRPPDFVTGEAASELAEMIQELRISLGCE
jgi:ELWxxDGT repeat protein